MSPKSSTSPPDAATARARWIAQRARVYGCSMADVRAMTFRDVMAMDWVITQERNDMERRRQAVKARGRRR